MKAFIILENGRVFEGQSMGATEETVCEMVFNTSMTGYQEVLTDPSYAGQGIVMTYPLIGNYGVNDEDPESAKPWPGAFIVRHLSPRGSNFRCQGSLEEYLRSYGITGVQGVDTREITRILRGEGVMNGMVTCDPGYDKDACVEKIKRYRVRDTVREVTSKEVRHYAGDGYKVALLDCGMKQNMLRSLRARGCDVTLFPAYTKAEEIIGGGFDGVILSNGPGDPADCMDIAGEIRKMCDAGLRIFGVCFGHQLVALGMGAKTGKLRYGHRGGNHPVKDLERGRVYITSQNHGYVVKAETLDPSVGTVSHINVNDGTVEGVRYKNGRVFTVQFHPEASPGPNDTGYLFDKFVDLMGGEAHA